MQEHLVFQDEKEIKRLSVQNSLLSCYEAPVLKQIFLDRQKLFVLDIGCNDGMKTVKRFSVDSASCVIGLEYNGELAKKAEKMYGDEKFSFYPLDVEAEDFSQRLKGVMEEKHIDGFDLIYLSFVLMHLSDVKKLLCALSPFLKKDGKLFIIEANDSNSYLKNDENGLLDGFLKILKKDKYSGNRELGADICEILSDCGYKDVCVWHDAVSAAEGEKEKKKAIFTTFFSYLPEDISLLLKAESDNEEYKSWSNWLTKNYNPLKSMIVEDKSQISMGIKLLTCMKGE